LKITELFEAGFSKLCASYSRESLFDALDVFEHGAIRDPKSTGELHPKLEGVWVYEPPPVVRLPPVIVVYTIDEEKGLVRACNIHVRQSETKTT
jgi:hypothetical protein